MAVRWGTCRRPDAITNIDAFVASRYSAPVVGVRDGLPRVCVFQEECQTARSLRIADFAGRAPEGVGETHADARGEQGLGMGNCLRMPIVVDLAI